MKDLHIGKLISLRIEQTGIAKAEFARRINRSPQNIQDLLTRKSVDTDLLIVISKALGYNFFKAFINYPNALAELKKKNFTVDGKTDGDFSEIYKTLDKIAKDNIQMKAEIQKLKKIK